MLTVRQVLALDVFGEARAVAGAAGLDREVRWAHPVDIPQANEWVREGELLLTTLYGYRDDPLAQEELCATLAANGLAGMVIAVGGDYVRCIPDAMRKAADAADFPLIELPWKVRFEDVVRAVSERIINEQYELYKQSLAIHRTLTRVVLDGGSLQDVARELCQLLDLSVEIDDVSFSVLATANSPDGVIDESRRGAITSGRSSTPLLDYLRRTGVLAKARTTLAPIRIDPDSQMRALGLTL
ncbi:MAG TPA: PucR family transcriptional regulator ligand-binding domain-containing protein, partial [Ktedonobacterales bacterium]|nr:PucR family transcriptional regulator ligand-binding domain-containing protein [Ktedonobacterales bacterium]